MPLPKLLDPQGKAVKSTLENLGYKEVANVRIGKHIKLEINTNDEETAKQIAEEISRKVLTNEIMEYFKITIEKEQD